MEHLHTEVDAGPDDVIEVTLNHQANIKLLDSINYQSYKQGRAYRGLGLSAKRSPVRLSPPRSAHWHVVIDLGGYAGVVRAAVQVIKRR